MESPAAAVAEEPLELMRLVRTLDVHIAQPLNVDSKTAKAKKVFFLFSSYLIRRTKNCENVKEGESKFSFSPLKTPSNTTKENQMISQVGLTMLMEISRRNFFS